MRTKPNEMPRCSTCGETNRAILCSNSFHLSGHVDPLAVARAALEAAAWFVDEAHWGARHDQPGNLADKIRALDPAAIVSSVKPSHG